jgi:hypothetical protein
MNYPICSVRAFNLWAETGGHTPTERIATIKRPRPCERFIRWEPALSLKDHVEMWHAYEQREFNRQVMEADRVGRAAEAAKVEDRHQQNRRDGERRFWLGFAGAVVVAIATQAFLAWIKPPEKPQIIVMPAPGQSATQAIEPAASLPAHPIAN